jgi:DNA-binding LytR/AlgR family response regulator
MPTAIIVEDEAPQRAELLDMLRAQWTDLRVLAQCEDGLAAVEALDQYKPDIAFIDIRIPGINGIEVAKAAGEICKANVVFTTAYDHYAVEAFNQRAIDYLLKPISTQRLDDCILRLKERLASGREANDQSLRELRTNTQDTVSTQALKWITTNVGNTIKMLPIDDVLFFQSQDKYTRVVTSEMDTHIRTPLKEIVAGLDPNRFWLIHRNAIVRVDAIDKVQRDDTGKMTVTIRNKPDKLVVSAALHYRFKVM